MSSIASADSSRRNLQLDILRGVAILLVLLCYSIHLRQPTWDMAVWRAGWSGVDLFFVVSGFLISGLLFGEYRKTGRIRFRRFAIRRAIKIYPAFYVLVLVTVAITLLRDPFWIRWPRLFHDVVFVQSYFQGTWGHFWSLSVEEHFYILLPLTMFFLIRAAGERRRVDPFAAIPKLFVGVAIALLIARLLTARYVPYSWQTHLFPTHLRLDSLFFGVVIAYWYHFHRDRFTHFATRHRNLILCAAAILLSPLFLVSQYNSWMYTYGFIFAYVGYGCLLVGFLHVQVNDARRPVLMCLRAIGYIGTFSYSIYLWHLFWIEVVKRVPLRFLPYPIFERLALFYVGSILVGIIAAKLVEFPALRLREHLFPPSAPRQSIVPVLTPACAGRET